MRVSAIITTHNRLELLKRAIDSVLNQTYQDIECIVVSDNSTDGTDEYCRSLTGITYISIPAEESLGGNHARNVGIKASKGEYVAFLDDDDYWLPEKIEKQVALAELHHADFIYCLKKKEIIDSGDVHYDLQEIRSEYCGDVSKTVLHNMITTSSAIMIRREALNEVGLFDENLQFWQDFELIVRLAQKTPFYCLNEPLTVYRVDTSDNARLTNQYSEWKKAVAYIRQKHDNLYAKLSFMENMQYRFMVYSDARQRCINSNKSIRALIYYLQMCLCSIFTPERIIKKITKILNSNRQKSIVYD